MNREIMSYTHTLSIQGVQAILQMNVENSVVKYTLTLRADSGEEVVTNGRLPNDAIDQFIVINQHFTHPELIAMPSKGLGDSLSSEVKQTLEQGVQTALEQSISEANADFEEMQELQDLSNKKVVVEEPEMIEIQPERMIQCTGEDTIHVRPVEPVQEEPLSQRIPFNEAVMMEKLQHLRTYSNPDIKHGIVQAVQDYLSENNINLLDYPALCEFMKELFYEMIVLHVDDNVLVGKFIKMLYLAGEQADDVSEFMSRVYRKYGLFCKVAAYYKIELNTNSFASFRRWNATYDGPVVDRWHRMKTFLLP